MKWGAKLQKRLLDTSLAELIYPFLGY